MRWLHGRFDRWQLARVRRAYVSGTGRPSASVGFAGMVEEMRRGLEQASSEERAMADERVLRTIFFGRASMLALRALAGVAPRWTARGMAVASPVTLRWLVGPISVVETTKNRVPQCRFRAEGGPSLCQQVCREPTETFCSRDVVPVRLTPDAEGPGCTWVWGSR